MNKVVNRIVQDKQIDLIYVKRLRSIQYVSDVKSDIPIILDVTDAMSLFYKRALRNAPWHKKILFAEEYFKYLAYEKRVAKKYRKWVTCSKIDREYLIKRLPDLDIEVIPNIVDTEYFLGKVSAEQNTFQHHSIIFSGLMDKFVNIEAADFLIRDIYPRIIKKYPDLKVYIVGPNPVSHIRKYRSTNIFVTGYVEDIRKYIEKADIVVCPIKTGTGVRNKILQAWAMGKPVVSTDQGLAGLVGVDGREILIANDGQSFAESIIKLFESESLRQLLIRNGNKIVKEKYSPEVMGQKLDQLVR
jgi:glycosyltransferase involved in cell wall biosynthesis